MTTRPLGPFAWRVRVLRASPGSVTTETTAHLCDDQGRARCGLVELTNTRPASISAARCTVCAEPAQTCPDCYGSGVIADELCPLCKGRSAEPLDEQRRRLPDTLPSALAVADAMIRRMQTCGLCGGDGLARRMQFSAHGASMHRVVIDPAEPCPRCQPRA